MWQPKYWGFLKQRLNFHFLSVSLTCCSWLIWSKLYLPWSRPHLTTMYEQKAHHQKIFLSKQACVQPSKLIKTKTKKRERKHHHRSAANSSFTSVFFYEIWEITCIIDSIYRNVEMSHSLHVQKHRECSVQDLRWENTS